MWLLGAVASATAINDMPEFPEDLELDTINTAQQCIEAAQDQDFIASLEHIIILWCRKIEKVRPVHLDSYVMFNSINCMSVDEMLHYIAIFYQSYQCCQNISDISHISATRIT